MCLVWGCSSLPDPIDQKAREVSDGYVMLEKSHRMIGKGEPGHALKHARRAQMLFSLADDETGMVLSNLHLSKLLAVSDPEESRRLHRQAKQLIELFQPSLWPHFHLHEVEGLFSAGAYTEVLSYLEPLMPVRHEDLEPIFYAYSLMSRIKLDQDPTSKTFQDDLAMLGKLALEQEKKFLDSRLSDPTSASFALYVCGLADSYRKEWKSAEIFYLKARLIDQRVSHFKGTADNLFGLGQCAMNLNRYQEAESYFERAGGLYHSLNDQESAKDSRLLASRCAELARTNISKHGSTSQIQK
jgi:tetratricopeptide (TPR) repeat protein